MILANRELMGENAAGLSAAAATLAAIQLAPLVGLPVGIALDVEANKVAEEIMQQQGRVALQLMDDAGYDPWQAPESERLAVEIKPPKKSDVEIYPDIAGYELSILSLTYKKPSANSMTTPAADSASAQP
jgi:hypothetical protein